MITRHRGDHFVVYTNITTLRYIPETNVISVIPQLKKKIFQLFLGTGFHYLSMFTKYNVY